MPKKQKILVVEDDAYIREIYEETLGEAGFDVTVAIDGEEGLVKIQGGGYSLIFLDIVLPKLNGVEVLAALKKNPPRAENGPIVLLTNLAHDPVIKEGLSLGAKDYLIKSDLNPDELIKKVKQFLGS